MPKIAKFYLKCFLEFFSKMWNKLFSTLRMEEVRNGEFESLTNRLLAIIVKLKIINSFHTCTST